MRVFIAAFALVILAACGGGSAGSPNPFPSASPTPAGPHLYVADSGNNSIFVFARNASSVALPQVTIAGAATQLASPSPIAVDPAGNIWVANHASTPDVLEFTGGAVGNTTPAAVMTVSSAAVPGPLGVKGLIFGPTGKMYVATGTGNHVMVYSGGANGTPAATQDISGFSTQLNDAEGIALDANGNIYTASFASNAILEFAANATGNIAPMRVIKGAFNTHLSSPSYVAVDSGGNVFTFNSGDGIIREYAANASGDVAPIVTLSFPDVAGQMLFDGAGNLLTGSTSTNPGGVAAFAPPITSSSVPAQLLQSPDFTTPTGVFAL